MHIREIERPKSTRFIKSNKQKISKYLRKNNPTARKLGKTLKNRKPKILQSLPFCCATYFSLSAALPRYAWNFATSRKYIIAQNTHDAPLQKSLVTRSVFLFLALYEKQIFP